MPDKAATMIDTTAAQEFVFSAESLFPLAKYFSVILFTLTVLLLIQVIILRFNHRRQSKLRSRFIDVWRPLLVSLIYEQSLNPPKLKPHELEWLLVEWNSLLEKLSGDAAIRMRELFDTLGIHREIDRMLYANSYSKLLLVVVFVGHVGYQPAWNRLKIHLDHPSPIISILAARSMMKIDARRSNKVFLEYAATRKDWPTDRFIDLFKRNRETHTATAIAVAIRKAHMARQVDYLTRLIPLLTFVERKEASAIKEMIFYNPLDDKVVSELLKLVDSPLETRFVYQYCWSDRWHVRMHALAAFGRIATDKHYEVFYEALSDPQWWVRYRAVEGFIDSRIITLADLKKIGKEHSDRYARDMITHVLAERGLS